MIATGGRTVDWAVACRPASGEMISGDAAVVETAGDRTLVAVVDALGHGPEAAAVASTAAAALRDHARDDVVSLIAHCHDALLESRGAAVTVASYSAADSTVTWAAVGNVEGRLLRVGGRPTEDVLLAPGVAGDALPPLRAVTLAVERGDMIALATDGIASGFADGLAPSGPPQRIADRILADHARPSDDALVVVARILGGAN